MAQTRAVKRLMPSSTRRRFLATGLAAAAGASLAGTENTGELAALTLQEVSERIRSRRVTPVELTQACLDRIRVYNPKINAWITVMKDQALAQARTLAEEQAAGHFRGPLHGIPIGLKDSIDTGGVRTTAASAVFENRTPSEDAEVVRRLKAAGAVLIGKCNMHEFDAGASAAVSYWGPVRNPWNLERIAGGPSGGSAAAVAMDNCFAALGTDSSGGIRTPAAYCGVVGFKPTYGLVSLRGLVPFAWSLDHCGPLARTVEDVALVLQQIAGYDPLDIDSVDRPAANYAAAIGAPVAAFRLGIPAQFYDHLDDEIARVTDDALAVLNKLTKGSRPVGLPPLLGTGAVTAETAAYHEDIHPVNGGGYEPATAHAFSAGEETSARDYIRAWRELAMVRRTVDEDVFRKQGVDLLVAPAARHAPHTLEEELAPGESGGRGGAASRPRIDLEANTRPFNGYGLPVITLPCGFAKDGMPVGLQIAGPPFGEAAVLALAHAYQQATEWHKRRPPLTPDAKAPELSKAAAEQTGG